MKKAGTMDPKQRNRQTIRKNFVPLINIKHTNKPLSYGFLSDTLPEELTKELEEGLQGILNPTGELEKYNSALAGEIEKEYAFKFSDNFKNYIFDLARYFETSSNGYIKDKTLNLPFEPLFKKGFQGHFKPYEIPELVLDDGWVNLQKKHEYNPPHHHSGLLSFVVWHKIPYKKENEHELGPGKFKNKSCSGDFSFIFFDGIKIAQTNLPVDNEYEGVIALFPSDLIHQVYPFYTSDEYRITFSGNLFLKNFESLEKFRLNK